MNIHVDVSEYDGKSFITIESLRIEVTHIPHIGDTYTTSSINGIYKVADRIVHFEKGQLFSVRLVVEEIEF